MQAILFFLSATLSLFSANMEKETPSVKMPKMAFNSATRPYSDELKGTQWASNTLDNERPIVLKSVEDIALDAPLDAKTHEADVAEMKKKVAKLTDIERSNAEFWQRHPAIRWNEFTREIVAAHNVPPRVLSDSSGYPTPSRTQPTDLARYPFANPPYTSRVFAYVSVAQHDALLVAQFYQTKFQKMSVKEGGQAATWATARHYPSTEAAVAAASAEVLKYLFPAAITEIEETVEKARQSAYSSGKYAESDIKAGEKLTEKNVRSIRPGHGLPPKHFPQILGRRALANISRGTPLSWGLFESVSD